MIFEKATSEEMEERNSQSWPFARMEVGDAVTVSFGEYGNGNPQIYAHTYGGHSGKKFRTKKVAPGVYRVWRVA